MTYLADRAGGDGRQVLTALEVAVALAHPGDVQLPHVESALRAVPCAAGRRSLRRGGHFIKHARQRAQAPCTRPAHAGSGGGARFIARRMIIFASRMSAWQTR